MRTCSISIPLRNPVGANMGSKVDQTAPNKTKKHTCASCWGILEPTLFPNRFRLMRLRCFCRLTIWGRYLAIWSYLSMDLLLFQATIFKRNSCSVAFFLNLQLTNKILTQICTDLPSLDKINQTNAKHKPRNAASRNKSQSAKLVN